MSHLHKHQKKLAAKTQYLQTARRHGIKAKIPCTRFHKHQWDHCRLSVQCENQYDEDLPKSVTQI